MPGNFQKPWPEKEHHSRIVRRPELSVDRQTQHIPVEMAASAQVGWAQQDPAAQYLHPTIVAAPTPGQSSDEHVRATVPVAGGASVKPMRLG